MRLSILCLCLAVAGCSSAAREQARADSLATVRADSARRAAAEQRALDSALGNIPTSATPLAPADTSTRRP